MKKLILAFLILSGSLMRVYSQETDYKELFLAAESYYLFEEFNEALPLYLRIHREYPDNDNINFKIGICYLNDPYQKEKSITYLEEAADNITTRYKENNFKEKQAPLEALFYLGNAYRVNNQLDQAKEYYQQFKDRMDPEIYDTQMVQDQINACDAAKKMMQNPAEFDSENLGDRINTRFADLNSVVSGDETKMAFISKLQFYDAVFYTEKVNGEWAPPRNIIPELGVDGDVYPTCLSYDGTEMFIYRNDEFIGNLYSSKLVDGKWTTIRKLNDNINTRFWESHASISKDGNTLYFSSNRKGGYGGLDIYRSSRQPNGEWGPPVNLGAVVNTTYNDDTPFITDTGDKIFFSSYGHYNMGGYDIFMSKKTADGTWAKPVNLGYPINTTDDNQFLLPVNDGQIAYYSQFDPDGGYGRNDIYRLRIYSVDHPRMYSVDGMVVLEDSNINPDQVQISVIDKSTQDTITATNPDQDGNFEFEVPRGSYSVVFDHNKFRKKILDLEVNTDTPIGGLTLSAPVALALIPAIMPVDESQEEMLLQIMDDSVIYASEGDVVDIRYNAAKGSTVDINAYDESGLVNSELVTGDGQVKEFSLVVKPGENIVKFSASDPEGNTVTKTVRIIAPTIPPGKKAETFVPKTGAEVTGTVTPGTGEDLSDADRLLDILKDAATAGVLKEFLDQIDPSEEGLTTAEDLIDYLYDSTETNDFTIEDVSDLLFAAGILSGIDLIVYELAKVSPPDLKAYLLGLDPGMENIGTERELFDHIYDHSVLEKYTKSDVFEAIARYKGMSDIEKIIQDLIGLSDGNLRQTLIDLDPGNEGIESVRDLLNYLLDKADENGYTREEVYDLFYRYFISGEIPPPYDEESAKERFGRGARLTAGILILEGLIILILILLARRKKSKKTGTGEAV